MGGVNEGAEQMEAMASTHQRTGDGLDKVEVVGAGKRENEIHREGALTHLSDVLRCEEREENEHYSWIPAFRIRVIKRCR